MTKYFCSADEYQHIANLRDNYAGLAKKVLARKPGTVAYESHGELAATAKGYSLALEAFSVRDGSQRSPDGSLRLSTQFQMDLEKVFAEARHELWGIDLPAEDLDPKKFPEVIISRH